VARLYARIAAVDLADDGDARSTPSPLWIGTAVALSACFAVMLACGPAANDDVFIPTSRSSRVEGGGCDSGAGVQAAGDDTCTVPTGTTGLSATTGSGTSGATASTAATASVSTGSGSGTTTGAVGAQTPPVG
jgi:hypothetical protein